jgi:hypothetical protein
MLRDTETEQGQNDCKTHDDPQPSIKKTTKTLPEENTVKSWKETVPLLIGWVVEYDKATGDASLARDAETDTIPSKRNNGNTLTTGRVSQRVLTTQDEGA